MLNLVPFRRALAFLLLSLASAFASLQARGAQPHEVDRIVAVVNDEAITQSELRLRIAQAERQLKAQNVPMPAADVFEKQILERLVTDRVQLQLAKETSLRVDDNVL